MHFPSSIPPLDSGCAGVAWPGCAMLTVIGSVAGNAQCSLVTVYLVLYSNTVKEEGLNNEEKVPLQELMGLRGVGAYFRKNMVHTYVGLKAWIWTIHGLRCSKHGSML